jgi:ubiquinone/menaquinone biosynthesis C-methylase UbiE
MFEQENKAYWSKRAPSYSEVNQVELQTAQRQVWRSAIEERIQAHFPDRAPEDIRVLEVGTGPGFFAILLAEAGYQVTAIDYTAAMLVKARENAGPLAGRIRFAEMNAEALDFADGSFDVVLSRNLTWNLPHPEQAYREWNRVLQPAGLLLNFDANWYAYLFDPRERAAYEADRQRTAEAEIKDEYLCTDIDAMEEIARQAPLSAIRRPAWDVECLSRLGMRRILADTQVWQGLWSEEEKINFHATPMFLVSAMARG